MILDARTPVEEIDRRNVGRVLHKPSVGIHQNFFGLGGHSLLAIEILCQLRKQFTYRVIDQRFLHEADRRPASRPVSERLASDGNPNTSDARLKPQRRRSPAGEPRGPRGNPCQRTE